MSLMVFIWNVIDTYPHEHFSTNHVYHLAGLAVGNGHLHSTPRNTTDEILGLNQSLMPQFS